MEKCVKYVNAILELKDKNMRENITIFGEEIIDEAAIKQLENCMVGDCLSVLTADSHKGYSMPVGGCIAYKDKISPSGVGWDIGCGNMAVRTDVLAKDIRVDWVMDEIVKRISFGVGRPNNEKVDHEVLQKIATTDFRPQRKMAQLAASQLGTVGSGNHYVILTCDDDGYVWIAVHFGSRGFGHKTCGGFMALSQGLEFDGKPAGESMDAKPTLFDVNSELGASYIQAMNLAGEYAYAGRECVVNKVLEILHNPKVTFSVHNHHNFCWLENHFGEDYWVVRKGCTPAFAGQQGFIGANMRDVSVIVEGVDCELSRKGLFSTVHGAGRVMSRTAAAGKTKWMRGEDGKKRQVSISKGLVDFDEVKYEMSERSIVLRGAGADEAPACYKSLEEVLKYQGDTIKILHRLRPIGVAMAGGEFDPYKD